MAGDGERLREGGETQVDSGRDAVHRLGGNGPRGLERAGRVADFGLEVLGTGLRDIILPGDMKMILNEVITAQKQAEANLIKRREETAATRSQLNTARLLAENPVMARLKELELAQEILAGTKATFVFGNVDVIEQVRRLTLSATSDQE